LTVQGVGTVAALADALAGWLVRLLPDRERAAAMAAELRSTFGEDRRRVNAATVAEVEAVGRGRSVHLELFHEEAADLVPDVDPPGWPPTDADAVRRAGGGVREVTRRDDGIGLLRLDGLEDVDLAAPFLEAAFELLVGSRAVVLDLRANGGGDPATVALLMSWWLGTKQRHYADVVSGAGVRTWWTSGRPAARSRPPTTPGVVLVSGRTFSSAEALAYFLQRTGSATVVGQVTRGAADHIAPVVLTPSVRGFLPEAFYRAPDGSSWEGLGVQPDQPCLPERTLEVALAVLDGQHARRPD
jgi:C-terminal processing protease CtpA/Prc